MGEALAVRDAYQAQEWAMLISLCSKDVRILFCFDNSRVVQK